MISARNRELLLWCLPALLLGAWLRIELLNGWRGGLYFGPDSGSYWETAFRFASGGHFEVSGKRPWLYPAIVWLTGHGPSSPAFSVALVQQFIAWLSILALGALVRLIVPFWKWFIIPATALYAGQPEILYWGHVLIADSLFISTTLAVALAVTIYWQKPTWQWLAITAALVFIAMALRPVGRTLWLPLIPIALLVPHVAWRQKFLHAAALALLYFPASAATSVTQGEDLLFASTFPLMRLDTPLHADLKAELRPQVEAARADLWKYVTVGQREVWGELIDDSPDDPDSILQKLRADKKRYGQVRREISREALRSDPLNYARMVVMKIYFVFALNESHDRLDPARWSGASEKFLHNAAQKIDPNFPAYVLRNATIASTLTASGSQQRVLRALNFFDQLCTPFSLHGKQPDRWWWIIPAALGLLIFPWKQDGHRLIPLLILTVGYLAMTFLVGRAVGRYRLPIEFTLYLTAAAGLTSFFTKRGSGNSGERTRLAETNFPDATTSENVNAFPNAAAQKSPSPRDAKTLHARRMRSPDFQ